MCSWSNLIIVLKKNVWRSSYNFLEIYSFTQILWTEAALFICAFPGTHEAVLLGARSWWNTQSAPKSSRTILNFSLFLEYFKVIGRQHWRFVVEVHSSCGYHNWRRKRHPLSLFGGRRGDNSALCRYISELYSNTLSSEIHSR